MTQLQPLVLLSDIRDNVNDMIQNYDVTSIDKNNVTRQINRGIEYFQRRLGLPSDYMNYSFYYYEDTPYYDMPVGFNEFLQLYYSTNNPNVLNHNVPRNRWYHIKDTEINNWSAGYQAQNKVATTSVNGKNQLLLSGRNISTAQVINNYDNLTGLTFSTDILNTSIDSNVYIQGVGSLKFDTSSSLTASTVTFTGNWNIQSLFQLNAAYRMYIYFPLGTAAQFSNVQITLLTSTGNYYSMTTTNNVNGTAWLENAWNLIGWQLANASTTGTPDSTNITSIIITLNHSGTYTSAVNMRINNLYEVNPDYLTVYFYSAYKGTDTTGTIQKIYLDDDSDICYFGSYAYDLIEPIAIRAAYKLFPQLRADDTFVTMYQSVMSDALTTWGKVYPHKRSTGNYGETEILRRR